MCGSKVKFGPPNRFDFGFDSLWKVKVPVKIKAFVWRCFLDRIPMKDSLFFRGIIPSSSNLYCVFCGVVLESFLHSLLL